MQLVSHEVAHLIQSEDGYLTGKDTHLGRLSSLAHLLKRWYGVAAILFVLIGGAAGAIFLSKGGGAPISLWLGPWIVLVLATAMNLWFSPGLAVMEGCGKVGQVARLRLVQSMLGYIGLWVALLSGGELWAATAVPVTSALCTAYWLKSHGNMLYWLASRAIDLKNQMCWKTDVLPLQWRIALSWASGYLIFNLFTPMVFSRYGAAEAGRLGMALTIFSALSTVGMSWVNAKAPSFTTHIALGERAELNKQFKNLFIRSTFFISISSVIFVVFAFCFVEFDFQIMSRIAPPIVLTVIGITTVVNAAVYSMAIYMRAHREEPMLLHSISMGLLISSCVYIGSIFGVLSMMTLYMAVSIFVSFPWAFWLFMKYYRRVA